MPENRLTPGKLQGLKAIANERGALGVLAIDQRGSLKRSLEKEFDRAGKPCGPDAFSLFKEIVVDVLGPHASAVLADPQYCREIIEKQKNRPGGLLIAAEKTGYQEDGAGGRRTELLEEFSAAAYRARGADAVKLLVYFNPDADPETCEFQKNTVRRVGQDCLENDVAFLLEYVGHSVDPAFDERSAQYAVRKPNIVRRSLAEFKKPEYAVDVHKIEFPVNMNSVGGTETIRRSGEKPAYAAEDAKAILRQISELAAPAPIAFLSAGVDNATFLESLDLARESGARWNGVLCGRATWKEGIGVFARSGPDGLRAWLEETGTPRMNALNERLAYASPLF